MTDRERFMETLHSVSEMVQGLDAPLTKEEIKEYFKELSLSSEQLEMVYQYVLHPQTQNKNGSTEETLDSNDELMEESLDNSTELSEIDKENSKYLEMYMDDLKSLRQLSTAEEHKLYTELINGDMLAMQPITDHWLPKVVEMARNYEKHQVNMEDLIQEGNIGLITGVDDLYGLKKMIDVGEYIKESIQKALEDYIDEESDESDWTNSMLAKATLIEEAKQAYAEEYVKVPTVKDLADYTKLSEEEIEDILKLSLDDIKKEEEKKSPSNNSGTINSPWTNMKFDE